MRPVIYGKIGALHRNAEKVWFVTAHEQHTVGVMTFSAHADLTALCTQCGRQGFARVQQTLESLLDADTWPGGSKLDVATVHIRFGADTRESFQSGPTRQKSVSPRPCSATLRISAARSSPGQILPVISLQASTCDARSPLATCDKRVRVAMDDVGGRSLRMIAVRKRGQKPNRRPR
jgi:hypothetical protein